MVVLFKVMFFDWLLLVKKGDFDGVVSVLVVMQELGIGNFEVQFLLNELVWIGNLEKFVGSWGKGDVFIQIYVDEEKMSVLFK